MLPVCPFRTDISIYKLMYPAHFQERHPCLLDLQIQIIHKDYRVCDAKPKIDQNSLFKCIHIHHPLHHLCRALRILWEAKVGRQRGWDLENVVRVSVCNRVPRRLLVIQRPIHLRSSTNADQEERTRSGSRLRPQQKGAKHCSHPELEASKKYMGRRNETWRC